MYSGGFKDVLLRMQVKDKERLNHPMKDFFSFSNFDIFFWIFYNILIKFKNVDKDWWSGNVDEVCCIR